MRVVVKSSNNVVNSRMHILLVVTGSRHQSHNLVHRYSTAVSLHSCLILLVTDVGCQ